MTIKKVLKVHPRGKAFIFKQANVMKFLNYFYEKFRLHNLVNILNKYFINKFKVDVS